jgi:hypothetical protein
LTRASGSYLEISNTSAAHGYLSSIPLTPATQSVSNPWVRG